MIYLFIYGVFALCAIPFRTAKHGEQYLDKFTTDWIRGIAILIIVIHHAANKNMAFQFLYPFQTLGYGAVAVFLLLSGYGLGMQYQYKTNYLDGFFANKILRLYVSFGCSYILLFVVALLYETPIPVAEVIPNLLTMTITGTLTWYIKVQAGLYGLFCVVFRTRWEIKTKQIVLFLCCGLYALICCVLKVQQCWWFTVLWFPVGVLLSYRKETAERWLKMYGCPCIILAAAVLISVVVLRFFKGNMGYPLVMDIVITISFMLVLFVLVYQVRFLSKPVQYIGMISLELYLIHSMLLTGYMGEYPVDSLGAYITYIGVSIGLSIVVKHLSGGIIKLLFRKR